ncbi:MAG: hypothetical protein KBG15_15200, partial [Kofleriaceae bacterium]|nr:hypothetical protein [Kofleriaceae bacterium]
MHKVQLFDGKRYFPANGINLDSQVGTAVAYVGCMRSVKMSSQASLSSFARLVVTHALPLVLACILGAGCTDFDGANNADGTVGESGGKADGADAAVIFEADNGKSFDVVEGQKVIVRLEESPVLGTWAVASSNRTFGYPESDQLIVQQNAPGRFHEFVWQTSGSVSKVGTHTVWMDRSVDDEVKASFSFTIVIKAKKARVVIDESNNGQTIEVREGTQLVVRLNEDPESGYEWQLVACDRALGDWRSNEYADGVREWVWDTKSYLSKVGKHTVAMEEQGAEGDVLTIRDT